ncbi:hypothetical protein ACWC9U_15435 [Streptomyces sp. 900116325]
MPQMIERYLWNDFTTTPTRTLHHPPTSGDPGSAHDLAWMLLNPLDTVDAVRGAAPDDAFAVHDLKKGRRDVQFRG